MASGLAPGDRLVSVRGRPIRVVLPNRRDVRLRLSAVIISLQVLGQTLLNFKVSVAQILVSIGFCALLEVVVTGWQHRALIWPASAVLTGNGIAFILRVNGTRHGDWWSLNGVQFFLLAGAVAMFSKYLVRPGGGRHVYNPSNIGLVAVLLVVGAGSVFPQYLWWGPLGVPVGLAVVVILAGAGLVLRSVRMWSMAISFLVPFTGIIALFAVAGRSFIASWHSGPIAGASYWLDICLSPELLIFVFFMMSDPRTAPATRRGRMAYGVATAFLASAFTWFQPTEYGIKLGILASLTVVCAVVPLLDRAGGSSGDRAAALSAGSRRARGLSGLLTPSVAAVVLISIAVPYSVVQLQTDPQVLSIERGPASPGARSIQ